MTTLRAHPLLEKYVKTQVALTIKLNSANCTQSTAGRIEMSKRF